MSKEQLSYQTNNIDIERYPVQSDDWYVAQYLKYGSVEEVFKAFRFDLYISHASYHRLVKKRGIIKNTGRREASLSELLHFFAVKALSPTEGIETLYYSKMPPSFQTSLATLHRTYNNILKNAPMRSATALLIHPGHSRTDCLLGQEVYTARSLGKQKGDFSLPMTFSQYDESQLERILRVLQQEVLTPLAISGQLSPQSQLVQNLNLQHLQPALFFDILDVRVQLFELSLPEEVCNKLCLYSYKLDNLEFHSAESISPQETSMKYRVGVHEMIRAFYEPQKSAATIYTSELNQLLLAAI